MAEGMTVMVDMVQVAMAVSLILVTAEKGLLAVYWQFVAVWLGLIDLHAESETQRFWRYSPFYFKMAA